MQSIIENYLDSDRVISRTEHQQQQHQQSRNAAMQQLRSMSRVCCSQTQQTRVNAASARDRMDRLQLECQNLIYEQTHLTSELDQCLWSGRNAVYYKQLQFHWQPEEFNKYLNSNTNAIVNPEVDVHNEDDQIVKMDNPECVAVKEDERIAENSNENPMTAHELVLKQLEFEQFERRRLVSECNQAKVRKLELIQRLRLQKEQLDKMDQQLAMIIKVSRSLQESVDYHR